MSVANYTLTTTALLNKTLRKVSSQIKTGINFECEEYAMTGQLKNFDIDVSAREMLVPIDLNNAGGVASIVEGGWEAEPSTPNVEEATVSYIILSKRFTLTTTQKVLDAKHQRGLLKKQLVYSGMKATQAIAADYSDRFYGFQTGALAVVVASTTTTVDIAIPYADARLGAAPGGVVAYTNTTLAAAFGARLAQMFRVGEKVALVTSGALAANGIVRITGVSANTPAAGTVRLTFATQTAPTITAGTTVIVKANATINASPTLDETDFGKSLTGIAAITNGGASLHGLTHEGWVPSLSSTAVQNFGAMDLRRLADQIADASPSKMDTVVWSRGVARSITNSMADKLRFASAKDMSISWGVEADGITFVSSRRALPGAVVGFAKEHLFKLDVSGRSDAPGEDELQKMTDRAGYVGRFELTEALVCTSRAAFGSFYNLNEA